MSRIKSEIKSFSSTDRKWRVKLVYTDDPEDWIEEKPIIGFGMVESESTGVSIEPFYWGGEFDGLICPSKDAMNLREWEVFEIE